MINVAYDAVLNMSWVADSLRLSASPYLTVWSPNGLGIEPYVRVLRLITFR